MHQIQAKEVSAVEADMDLYPPWEATEHFGAGLASYFGMVKLAEELAVILYKDPRAAVVVSDRLGKDYAPLVCRFVCILAKGMSHSLFDELKTRRRFQRQAAPQLGFRTRNPYKPEQRRVSFPWCAGKVLRAYRTRGSVFAFHAFEHRSAQGIYQHL